MARILIVIAFAFAQLLCCATISKAQDFLDTKDLDAFTASHPACNKKLDSEVAPCINKTQIQMTQLMTVMHPKLFQIEQMCCLMTTLTGCIKPALSIKECKEAKPKIEEFIGKFETQMHTVGCSSQKVCKNGVTQSRLSLGLVALALSMVILFQHKLFN